MMETPISDRSKTPFLERVAEYIVVPGLSLVPGPGSVAASVISAALSDLRDTRWQQYLAQVEQRVGALEEGEIDEEFFRSPCFLDLLHKLYLEVVTSADDIKTQALKDYLVAYLWKNGPDTNWKMIFWDYLKRLSGSHLAILKYFYEIQRKMSFEDRFKLPKPINDSPISLDRIEQEFSNFDHVLVTVLISDLEAIQLVRQWGSGSTARLAWSMTDSGILFFRFLSLEWAISA